MKPEITTLSSGLTIMTVPNKAVETVNVMILTKAGSRFENDKQLGIAHFLEHMTFKGTTKRPNAIEINREIELLGARTNAFTWQEFTGYYIQGNKSHIAKYLDILSDIYLNSTYPQEEMDKERGVIIEEIKLHKDEPMYRASDLFFEATFNNSVLGRSILGSAETIKSMVKKDFIDFRSLYSPSNTLVAIAGNVEEKDAVKIVSDAFCSFSGSNNLPNTPNIPIIPKILLESRKNDQAHLRLGIKTVSINSELTYISNVLDTVIGHGLGSMMFELLREKMGLAYYCSSSNVYYTDCGVLELSTGVATSKLEEALKRLMEELHKISEKGISEKELLRAKEYIKGGLFMGLETTEGLNEHYAFDLLLRGKTEDPNEYAKKLDAVTNKDIMEFMKGHFKMENLSLAVVADYEDEAILKAILGS